MIRPRDFDIYTTLNEKWKSCVVCGDKIRTTYELRFDTGSVEPTVGETVTGGTSGDTGVVSQVTLEGGTWSVGTPTAYGTVTMTGCTGVSSDLVFSDNELVTGSSTGIFYANGAGKTKVLGTLRYPGSYMVRGEDDRWYCKPHYAYRWRRTWQREDVPDIDEDSGWED